MYLPDGADPCRLCETTGGERHANRHRPARINTAKYGLPGRCCSSCYNAVRYRFKHGLDPETGERLAARVAV